MEWPTEDCFVVVAELDCSKAHQEHYGTEPDGPIVEPTLLSDGGGSLEAAKKRCEMLGDAYGETRIAKLVWVDLEKEGQIRIFHAESDFEIFCDEMELPKACKKLWDDPPGYTPESTHAWYDFLKYIWIEYPDDRPDERLTKYLDSKGLIEWA